MQISDTLQFLHAEANLVHCSLSPEAVMLTAAGAWKLASLGHCVQVTVWSAFAGEQHITYDVMPGDLRLVGQGHQWGHLHVTYGVGLNPPQVQYTVDEAAGRTFDYVEGAAAARLLAPPLNYVAPELIASNGASAPPPLSPASDMFSLGATKQNDHPLHRRLQCGNTACTLVLHQQACQDSWCGRAGHSTSRCLSAPMYLCRSHGHVNAGCIAYELLAQRPFMPPRCSVTDHQAS